MGIVNNFAAIKTAARQAVHDVFAITAMYTDSNNQTPVQFNVRWHNKLFADTGNLESAGYAQVFEGVDSVVFSAAEIANASIDPATGQQIGGVTPQQNGVITFPDYNLTFILDTLTPSDGPVNVRWNVVRDSLV